MIVATGRSAVKRRPGRLGTERCRTAAVRDPAAIHNPLVPVIVAVFAGRQPCDRAVGTIQETTAYNEGSFTMHNEQINPHDHEADDVQGFLWVGPRNPQTGLGSIEGLIRAAVEQGRPVFNLGSLGGVQAAPRK
jgi:hypothetical protein